MRIITRLIIALLLLTGGGFLLNSLFKDSGLKRVSQPIPDSVRLDISRSYIISPDAVLDYTLTQSPRKLWISSAAILSGADNKTARYPYRLKVTVKNSDDKILYENEFHHHARATTRVELKANQQIVPEAFLANEDDRLAAMENLHISLPEGATRLVISQIVKSPDIKELAVRAYQHVQRSSRVSAIDLWQRLSQRQRNDLLQHYPFDIAFLSDAEKANLAEFRWQPLVPSGDENQDYQSVLIYRIPLTDIAIKRHLLSQYEHHADAYKRISFPIEVAGKYRIEGAHEFRQRNIKLNMSWFNQNDSWEKRQQFEFTESPFSQVVALQPGLVTFTSSIPVSMSLFAETGFVEEHDHFAPTVLLHPQTPLLWQLAQGGTTTTPYQLQVRAFAEQDMATGENAEVTLKLFAGDNLLQTRSLKPSFVPEQDTQLANEEFFNWLGEKSNLYVTAPANADRIEVSSNQPVLTSLFTRLESMPAMRTLPVEKRDWYDYAKGVPDWFAVRPESWAEQINRGNIRVLKNYHRSLLKEQPAEDPDETYQSLLNDFSRLTLSDLIVENPYPGQPVRLAENTALNFALLNRYPNFRADSPLARPYTRKLFFTREQAQPQQIQWQKNGTRQQPFWIAGHWGIVDESILDTTLIGNISMASSGVQWWRNDVPREQAQWQQRRALLVRSGEALSVENEKQSEQEMLTFVLYQTTIDPVTLKVELLNTQPVTTEHQHYTILKRRFQIQPHSTYSGYQLSGKRRLAARQSFSILLDKDLANTEHQIRLTLLQGNDVYLSMVKRVIQPTPIIERYRTELDH